METLNKPVVKFMRIERSLKRGKFLYQSMQVTILHFKDLWILFRLQRFKQVFPDTRSEGPTSAPT